MMILPEASSMHRLAQVWLVGGLSLWLGSCSQLNVLSPDDASTSGESPDGPRAGQASDVPIDSPGRPGEPVDGMGAPPGPPPPGTKFVVGKACAASPDCETANCIDGVCCATTCDGKCNSCALVNTGKADGTCAPVQTGSDPHNDCAKDSDPCGLDGACDGAGACRKAGPDVVCKPEQCAAGQYTGPSQCDGKGVCVTPAPLSCGN